MYNRKYLVRLIRTKDMEFLEKSFQIFQKPVSPLFFLIFKKSLK